MGWFEDKQEELKKAMTRRIYLIGQELKKQYPELSDRMNQAKRTRNLRWGSIAEDMAGKLNEKHNLSPDNLEDHFNALIPKLVQELDLSIEPPLFEVDPDIPYTAQAISSENKIHVQSADMLSWHYGTLLEELHHLDYYHQIGFSLKSFQKKMKKVKERYDAGDHYLDILCDETGVSKETAATTVAKYMANPRWENSPLPIDHMIVSLLPKKDPVKQESGFFGNPESGNAFELYDEGQARYQMWRNAARLGKEGQIITISQILQFLDHPPTPEELSSAAVTHDLAAIKGMVMFSRLNKELTKSDFRKMYATCKKLNTVPGFTNEGELIFYKRTGERANTQHIMRSAFGKKARKLEKKLPLAP